MTDTSDANSSSPLDSERLHELLDSLGVDATELKEMVLLRYMNTMMEGFPILAGLLAAKDAPGFRLKSHQLKGSSLNAGAMPLAAVLMGLEEMGKKGDLSQAQPEIDRAHLEFSRLRGYIDSGAFMQDLAPKSA
jgi:HPt (histidine-containing phosphotransfer) domain-containing protein